MSRPILRVRDPKLDARAAALVAGLQFDDGDDGTLIARALIRWQDDWADESRCGRRYSDREAARREPFRRV